MVLPKAGSEPELARQFITDILLSDWLQQRVLLTTKPAVMKRHYENLPEDAPQINWETVFDEAERSPSEPLLKEWVELQRLMATEIHNYILGRQELNVTIQNLVNGAARLDLEDFSQ